MKRKAILLITVFVLVITSFANAVERKADHDELRALREKITNAINSNDIAALGSCFAKEFSFTTIDQQVITSRDELQSYYDAMFKGDDAIVETITIEATADIETRFTSENTGYNYGTTVERYTLKNGKTSVMNSRWSVFLIKEEGQWKIASAHAGVNFMDNPYLHYKSMSWFDSLLVFLHLVDSPLE